MRTGKTLPELAAQIKTEQGQKKDFVANTTRLEYLPEGGPRGQIHFRAGANEYDVEPTQLCLRQIGERVGIPANYMERMAIVQPENSIDHRPLLAHNINYWFKQTPENRMIRTLMNGAQIGRAFLSERYRPLDNADLAEAVLPRLVEAGCEIVSSEITEKRLYIQAATPRLELDLNALRASGITARQVDPVRAGVVISNSEVGCGAIKVEPMLYRLVCLNGMIVPQSIRRHHVGRATGVFAELEAAAEYFSDRTRELDDRAFWAKVNDVVAGVFDMGKFRTLSEKFAATKDVRIVGATEVIESVGKQLKWNEGESKSVLDHLIKGGDLSQFGLVNAVTRTAEDVETYDRAIEFERMGGEILLMPPKTFGLN